jgi:hypothetical protein
LTLLEPQQHDLTVFWENPNIHPYLEYRSRYDAFLKFVHCKKLPLLVGDDGYGLERFLAALGAHEGLNRCAVCYDLRMTAVARRAVAAGFEAFSTTLLISPYQNHELLIQTGTRIAAATGLKFFACDLRPAFRQTHQAAREFNLYKQKYCGCIFSEYDRYKNDARFALPRLGDLPETKSHV